MGSEIDAKNRGRFIRGYTTFSAGAGRLVSWRLLRARLDMELQAILSSYILVDNKSPRLLLSWKMLCDGFMIRQRP